ncbi:MAG: DUF5012 domain-containing protein [Bacteroidaceae bacterium]|nr:DUF5012 domain-containing protein [Bacteroidaceae bacterium]
MKRIFLYGLMICMTSIGFMSCSGDDELTDTRVTNFANFLLEGDEFMVVNVGEPFTDPGFTVMEGTEDITDKTVVTGEVDPNTCGFYTINYSAVNKDNFSASAERTVMVINPNSLASAYLSEAEFGTRHYYNLPVIIEENEDGTFTIDDIAGGFYAYGRYPGYPYDFSLETVLKLNDDNTIEVVDQNPKDWFWELAISITSGTYDPETGTIKLELDFDGDPMKVTLTK